MAIALYVTLLAMASILFTMDKITFMERIAPIAVPLLFMATTVIGLLAT